MDENIFDLSPEAFQAAIAELRTMGYDTDDLTRQYRSANSPFASINNAADNFQQGLADDGRRSVLGGLLSKVEGSTGMDAIRGLNFEGLGGLLGAGQAVGRAIDAPGAAYQGLIPRGDMADEAMNVAGMAMGAGGAATAPGGALRAGLAREGLSEAQRQARDILDMRAAGRAGDVTDDMMARADPQYMYDNTPLPMDEASRLDRADAGGFGGDLYHGTNQDFPAFNSMPWGGQTPNIANEYAASTAWNGSTGQQVLPVRMAVNSPINADRMPRTVTIGDFVTEALDQSPAVGRGDFNSEMASARVNNIHRGARQEESGPNYNRHDFWNNDQSMFGTHGKLSKDALMGQLGFDGVNMVEMGEPTTGAFNTANARSRFARFDPEFSHLSNLSAANASPAGLLAMQPEQETRPLPFMEMLRGLLQ
jgi:hypothetical protein